MRVAEKQVFQGQSIYRRISPDIAGSGGKSSNYLCAHYHHFLNMNIGGDGNAVYPAVYSFPGKVMDENSFGRRRGVGHIWPLVFISRRKS
jgi:hypothetical protein